VISPREAERRIRRVSQLRALILRLKAAARAAYRAGRIPWEPTPATRSDPETWKAISRKEGEQPPA